MNVWDAHAPAGHGLRRVAHVNLRGLAQTSMHHDRPW